MKEKIKAHETTKEHRIDLIQTDKRLRKWLYTSLMTESEITSDDFVNSLLIISNRD